MTTSRRIALCVLLLALLTSPTASAATRRVAVVVGNNAGSGARPALQFAENDAAKVATVLTELGGLETADVFLLRGAQVRDIERALDEARRRIAAWHAIGGTRVVLTFFFSGHSDGEALEIGTQRLSFGEVRRLLAGTGADVRLAVVDSCKSGALLALKGGKLAPGFEIRLTDELASSGEAVLTSAAADESALESREIRGSFFSHHLVSGLRGAADTSGDGRVTLAEAYRYAFAQTVSATSETLPGPQHPAYDYRLSGQGELVLTELFRRSASIELPAGYRRILITERSTAHVVAELATGASLRVAVPPGEYVIRAFDGDRAFTGNVVVRQGDQRLVAQGQLQQSSTSRPGAKGDDASLVVTAAPAPTRWSWRRWQPLQLTVVAGRMWGMVGWNEWGHEAREVLYVGRLELHPVGSGPIVGIQGGQNSLGENAEGTATLHAGYRLALKLRRFHVFAAAELTAGARWQHSTWGGGTWSGLVGAALVPGISVDVWRRLSLTAEGYVPAQLLKRDGETALSMPWAAWVGISLTL